MKKNGRKEVNVSNRKTRRGTRKVALAWKDWENLRRETIIAEKQGQNKLKNPHRALRGLKRGAVKRGG